PLTGLLAMTHFSPRLTPWATRFRHSLAHGWPPVLITAFYSSDTYFDSSRRLGRRLVALSRLRFRQAINRRVNPAAHRRAFFCVQVVLHLQLHHQFQIGNLQEH